MTAFPASDRTASDNVVKAMRAMRQKLGLSCRELSEQLAAQGHHLSKWVLTAQEQGRSERVSVDQVVALAGVFGVPIDRLLNPVCETCQGLPPAGFTCNDCDATGKVEG